MLQKESFSPVGDTSRADNKKIPTLTSSATKKLLKKGIWVYFLLVIFEGALRKWFLPALASPLLIIRDPLALWLIVTAVRNNLLRRNFLMVLMVFVGIVSVFTAVIFCHGNLLLATYGARVLILHFPVIFVIGTVFTRKDVLRMGKITLFLSIPMAVLVALQFYSSQSAWVNRGVGGSVEGAGFGGALGYFRPPGTFSFTNGNTLFFGLVASFLFYFWFQSGKKNVLLLFLSTVSLMTAIPFSISRGLLFQVGVSILFAVISIIRNPKYLPKIAIAFISCMVLFTLLSNTAFFQTSIEAFTARYTDANETEGGLEGVLIDRFLGGMVYALSSAGQQPFFGDGIGMGTNVAEALLSTNTQERLFYISDAEWGRIIGEMGPLMGIIVIFVRVGFCIQVFRLGVKRLMMSDTLAWMLLSYGLITVGQGQWAQPTAIGFSTLIGGLILASLHKPKQPKSKASTSSLAAR